ncbi:hypothetical protein HQ447_10085 [bacterium]|nr:hypothetical protein [bacterium]
MIPLHRSLPGLTACGFVALLAGCASTTDSFAKLDTNRDGSGSPAEFDTYMKAEVFTRVDTNRDAKVTRAEWQQTNPKVTATKFRNTDTNRDAAISRPEADAGFDREGSLKKLFAKIDSDHDGSLDRAEVTDFKAKVAQAPGSSPVEKTLTAVTQP